LSLNRKECKKFEDYLNSPYFNKRNKTLTKLYLQILKDFKTGNKVYCEDKLTKKVYGKLNKRKYKFDLQKLREHFERFIALQHGEENSLKFEQFILEDYLQRADGRFFEKKYDQIKKRLNRKPKGLYYYQHSFAIEALLDHYIKRYSDKRVGDTNLQAVSDAADQDFLLKKLCCLVLMRNRQNIATTNYNFGFKLYVLDYFKNDPKIEEPLIKLLYYAYEILSGTDKENALQKLNEQLGQSDQRVTKDIIILLFTILQNNLKFFTSQQRELHQQLFNLYDVLLKQNYIQTNGMLPVTFFKNIVSTGLELDKHNYVENIIEQYKNKLSPDKIANEAYAYNRAKFLIYKGEPGKASELIKNVNFKDAIFKIDLKCLQIMLFYDLEEHNLLEASINAFNVALTPHRLPIINAKAYRNFIKHLKKMYAYQTEPNTTKGEIEQLKESIEKTIQITNRKWLIMRTESAFQI